MNTDKATTNLKEQTAYPFKPLSGAEMLSDLKESREQITSGEYLNFDDALKEIENDELLLAIVSDRR